MSRRKSTTQSTGTKPGTDGIVKIIAALLGLIGAAIAAYFGYLEAVRPVELALRATATAEARPTAPASALTPSQSVAYTSTPTTTPLPTNTPTPTVTLTSTPTLTTEPTPTATPTLTTEPTPTPTLSPSPTPTPTLSPSPTPTPTPKKVLNVSTKAGISLPGCQDGSVGGRARFDTPVGIAVDNLDNVFVADSLDHRIRKITPKGEVSTLAGNGNPGFQDGSGSTAQFNSPVGIGVDGLGNIYVADSSNHRIRKISPQGEVSTLAGSGVAGFQDGPASTAQFNLPQDVAVDEAGNVYVADWNNHRVRKISQGGEVTTLAGSKAGFADGLGDQARFRNPGALAVDDFGNIYVADSSNRRIRKIDPNGMVTTLAGDGTLGTRDGPAGQARFSNPRGIELDASGNVYVADSSSHRIRKMTPTGEVSTLAGIDRGFRDGPTTRALFNYPRGVAVDRAGTLYVADSYNRRIRRIAQGEAATLAGDGFPGSQDGAGTPAKFKYPTGVAVDSQDNLYVADMGSHTIRKITREGIVSMVAGNCKPGYQDGTGQEAQFHGPRDVAIDDFDNIYVADSQNHRIRKISPAGKVTTIAGTGEHGFRDGPSSIAQFNHPIGIAVDDSQNIYVADLYNHRIRKISPEGVVTTLIGPAKLGSITLSQELRYPRGVAIDDIGNVYIADSGNHRIRMMTPEGELMTLAGSGLPGFQDGLGNEAEFNLPTGIAVDSTSTIYVADSGNHAIRKITHQGDVSTVAGNGQRGFREGEGREAQFAEPNGIVIDRSGNVYIADSSNHRIRWAK
jgi:sugar lactone lactonase YvrE